jgi:transcriptional regulator
MYVPSDFAQSDVALLHEVMAANSFATVVSGGKQGLLATHVPVLIDRDRGPNGVIVAHVARANPHWQDLAESEAMVVFQGPHGYVSPRWYTSPRMVPTWNYVAVHAYGRARLVWDANELKALVSRLAARHEAYVAEREGVEPWTLDGLPEKQLGALLKAIVGVEIPIARLEGKFKLNQNRTAADRRGVVDALAASGDPGDRALADAMTRHAMPLEVA